MATLADLGERRIVREIFGERYGGGWRDISNDDCAVLAPSGKQAILATTDPCPPPMAFHLGYADYYFYGWLLGTINFSDLAAMGATPVGLLTSLMLPGTTEVDAFLRLLDGVDGVCHLVGTRVVGGNIKEGPELSCSGTALGLAEPDSVVGRAGAKVGDAVVVVGELGDFWAFSLSRMKGLAVDGDMLKAGEKNVLTPRPKVREGRLLAQDRLMSSCIDNSDGLYPSLIELARASKASMCVRAELIEFSDAVVAVAGELGIEPMRLAMGWGDWQLVGTVERDKLGAVNRVLESEGTPHHVVGEVVDGGPEVLLEAGGLCGPMMPLESERFVRTSWFTSGLGGYVEAMLGMPLLQASQARGPEGAMHTGRPGDGADCVE